MAYEPTTIPNGSTVDEYALAPGVMGLAIEHEGAVYIPVIRAMREGSGDVGRFIDSLSDRCRISNVVSNRLLGMLCRRGWEPVFENDENLGDVKVWVRKARKVGGNG
jgi:hypothetical protein